MTVLYPFDPTGLAFDNLVIEEAHAVTEAHYRDYHFLIPDFAPFYGEGLVIRLAGSDPEQILVSGVDYFEVLPYEGATRSIGKPIYGAIALNSRWTTGVLLLTYQTLGGKWVADRATVYKTLAERAYNPRVTVWDVLTNVTDQFPPINHTQNFSDYFDEGDLIRAIGRLGTDIAREADALPIIRHLRNRENPHNVTKTQLGIPLIENWRMAAVAEALAGAADDILINPTTLLAVREAITTDFTKADNGLKRYVAEVQAQLERHRQNVDNPHQVTKAQLGLGDVGNWPMAVESDITEGTSTTTLVNPAMLETVRLAVMTSLTEAVSTLNDTLSQLNETLVNHQANHDNPHQVTKAQVGLGKVGDWPMATTAQTLLGEDTETLINPARLKDVRDTLVTDYTAAVATVQTALTAHQDDTTNPHQVTKAQVGLDLVENYPLATDLEVASNLALDKYVTLRQIVNYLSAGAGFMHSLTASPSSLFEGDSVEMTLSTTRIANGTVFYWAVVHGTTTADEFVATHGDFFVLNNVGTFTVTTLLQVALNPDRDFSVLVRENNPDGRVVALSDPLTLFNITKLPDYSLSATNPWVTLQASNRIVMNLTVTNTPIGTTLYWEIGHINTTAADFVQSSGEFITTGTTYSWWILANPSLQSQYLSSFKIRIRKDAPDGEVVCVSDTLTFQGDRPAADVVAVKSLMEPGVKVTAENYFKVTNFNKKVKHYSGRKLRKYDRPDIRFTATPSLTAINEGDSLTYTLASNQDLGHQTYYWRVEHNGSTSAGDFVNDHGSLNFNGMQVQWTVQTQYRTIDDPDRQFAIAVYNTEYYDHAIATAAPVQLINVATATAYTVRTTDWNVYSKRTSSVSFNVTTAALDTNTILRWRILHLTTEATDFSSDTGFVNISDHAGTFTVNFTTLIKRQTIGQFRVQLWEMVGTTALTASAIVTVYSDLQAAAVMGVDSLYDPFVTPTARNYYWVNNVGRRHVLQQPVVDHHLQLTSTAVVNEGNVLYVTLHGDSYVTAPSFFWRITHGTTTNSDFTATYGTVTLSGATAVIPISTIMNPLNTGDKLFTVDVWYSGSVNGTTPYGMPALSSEVLTISNVMVYDPVYAISTTATTYNTYETMAIPVTVTTQHTSDRSYTWKIENNSAGNGSFVLVQGTVTTVGGSAAFTVTVKDAITAYHPATFSIGLYDGTTRVATTSLLTINSPTYSLVAGTTIAPEGTAWPMTVQTTYLPVGATLYWTVELQTAVATQFTAVSGSVVLTGATTYWTLATQLDMSIGLDRTFTVALRTGSVSGPIVSQTAVLTISDLHVPLLDRHWAMPCCLYEATKPIDAADYYRIGTHATLRR